MRRMSCRESSAMVMWRGDYVDDRGTTGDQVLLS
jgi:hypothetical protein